MKHKIKLADNWDSPTPFMTDWDTNLIGPKLRGEFGEFIDKLKEEYHVVTGGSKKINAGEELKKFMIRKRINLVDDPSTGTLKSQFVLKKGETLEVDDQAWESLKRFKYDRVKRSDGSESDALGFIEHLGSDEKPKDVIVEIEGDTVEYFERPEEQPEKPEEPTPPAEFVCKNCGKKFKTARQLQGHNLSCQPRGK